MTFFFGFLFVVNTITLGYFYAQESNASVVDTVVETTDVAAPAAPQQLPAEPAQAAAAESNTSK
jgi:preprotein translocase subunit SecG